jgi:hypothetical protein
MPTTTIASNVIVKVNQGIDTPAVNLMAGDTLNLLPGVGIFDDAPALAP